MRTALALAFLGFQLVMVVSARFSDARYFAWAPHDSQNEYQIRVSIDGSELAPEEVVSRYRLTWDGVNPRAIEHLIRLVRQHERTHGATDDAEVVIRYRTNGRAWQEWRWPER